MAESASSPSSPARRPSILQQLEDWIPTESRLTVLSSILLILLFVAIWEGIKWVGKSSDYHLDIGITELDLTPTRNLTMPHIKDILGALSKPAQRNGPPLLEQLIHASAFTLREALLGFTIGTVLGLFLAVIFVHSTLLRGGLMPYVVASQTVPILALAPMVIIWVARLKIPQEVNISVPDFLFKLLDPVGILGRPLIHIDLPNIGVAMIAAYLTFFPVTIYALRGLSDVPATSLELMQSYAASRWEILWKLRAPNAMPYIFTALKITAPASIVGAIIGELPSGIQDGLGGQIINFNQYYITGPNRLWATNLITALLGIAFFVAVAIAERMVVRWKYPNNVFNRLAAVLWRIITYPVRVVVNFGKSTMKKRKIR